MPRKTTIPKTTKRSAPYGTVLRDVSGIVEGARLTSARTVNALMTASYWEIGRRIVEHEQGGKRRAGYGDELLDRLSFDLSEHFGRGFGRRNLFQMRAFYSTWPNIVQTVSAQLKSSKGSTSQKGNIRIVQTVSAQLKKRGSIDATAIQIAKLHAASEAFRLPWSHYCKHPL